MTRRHHTVRVEGAARANVRAEVYHTDTLRRIALDRGMHWEEMDRAAKLALSRSARPANVAATSNLTTFGLHRAIVADLDPDSDATYEATHLAVGDGTDDPEYENDSLHHEVYRLPVTSTENRGRELYTSTFLDAGEANGVVITEVGLMYGPDNTDDVNLLNHAIVLDEEKTVNKTITFDITLGVDDRGR